MRRAIFSISVILNLITLFLLGWLFMYPRHFGATFFNLDIEAKLVREQIGDSVTDAVR